MAISIERQRQLTRYLESLVGLRCDYKTLDCYRFIQGWAREVGVRNLPDLDYATKREAGRVMLQWGGRDCHFGLDFGLPRRKDGEAQTGDICYHLEGKHVPLLGIYAGNGKGYFLRHECEVGGVPYVVLPCEFAPVWRVD